MIACGMTPEELLQEVQRYVAQKRLHYSRMRINQVDLTPQVQLRSITPVEARQVLSDLLVLVTPKRRS